MTILWLLLCCVLDQIEDDVSMFSAKKTRNSEEFTGGAWSLTPPPSPFRKEKGLTLVVRGFR